MGAQLIDTIETKKINLLFFKTMSKARKKQNQATYDSHVKTTSINSLIVLQEHACLPHT